jgi:hypothetical protein
MHPTRSPLPVQEDRLPACKLPSSARLEAKGTEKGRRIEQWLGLSANLAPDGKVVCVRVRPESAVLHPPAPTVANAELDSVGGLVPPLAQSIGRLEPESP